MKEFERPPGPPPDREAEVRWAWRAASCDEPPASVDAEILGAARRAVHAAESDAVRNRGGRRPEARGWPFATAAAVAGLAFVLTQSLPRDPRPEPTHSTPPLPSNPAVPGTADAVDRSGSEVRGAREPSIERAEARAKAAQPSPPPPVTVAPRAVEHSAQRRSVESFGEAVVAPEAPALRVVAAWEAGDLDRAALELRALRATDPGAEERLPESVRDWARSVE